MAAVYSAPDTDLLMASQQTIWSCKPGDDLRVIPVKDFRAVIAMVPHPFNSSHPELDGRFFVVEKLGLDVMSLADLIPEDIVDESLDT